LLFTSISYIMFLCLSSIASKYQILINFNGIIFYLLLSYHINNLIFFLIFLYTNYK